MLEEKYLKIKKYTSDIRILTCWNFHKQSKGDNFGHFQSLD